MPEIDVDLVSRRLAEIKQLLGELRNLVELGLKNLLIWPDSGTCSCWKIDDRKVYEIMKKDVSDVGTLIANSLRLAGEITREKNGLGI